MYCKTNLSTGSSPVQIFEHSETWFSKSFCLLYWGDLSLLYSKTCDYCLRTSAWHLGEYVHPRQADKYSNHKDQSSNMTCPDVCLWARWWRGKILNVWITGSVSIPAVKRIWDLKLPDLVFGIYVLMNQILFDKFVCFQYAAHHQSWLSTLICE